MNKPVIPKRYLYLDVGGLDSLFAQTVHRLETEKTISHGKTGKIHLSGRAGLGEALGSLFGLLKFDGELGADRSSNSTETTKMIVRPEQKLQELLQYLSQMDESTLFTDLEKAASYLEKNRDAVFIDIQCDFDTPQFNSGGVNKINQDGYLLFTHGMNPVTSYKYGDSYFKATSKIKIMMSASVAKFPNCPNGMGATGHEATFIRGHNGINIPLNVFGSLFKTPEFFQIKPYAISF